MKHNVLSVYRALETLDLFKGKLKVFQTGVFPSSAVMCVVLGLSIRTCSSIF